MADLLEDIKTLIRTRHAIVTIQTLDESYAARTVALAGREMGLDVMEWSVSQGLRRVAPVCGETLGGTDALRSTLAYVHANEADNIYILKDALRHLTDPATERLLRDIALRFCRDNRTVFMIDAGGSMPQSLQPLAVPLEVSLPDPDEITRIVKGTFRELTRFGEASVAMNKSQFEKFLANLQGLTRLEISQVVADAVLSDGRLGPEDVMRAAELKRQRLRQTGVLDYIPPPDDPPSVGGMARLRKWLSRRAKAFSAAAREFGLEPPRGILMLGVQGCGKSLMAKFVAADWKLPLLRMDVGSLYDKYVGETERHLRHAFKVASAMAPCVLWIDEIEKAFASAAAGAAGAASDGGLSQRLFGQLLTWMQDRKEFVFIVATANDVKALPPELLRKGRFDEVFFVDLPRAPARKSIFRIHLRRRRRTADDFDLDALAKASDGFSGSEIEQAVVAAMYAAFADGRELTTKDVLDELAQTRPLSILMSEKIGELRQWARGRCVGAD
jgi:hypothetical protein